MPSLVDTSFEFHSDSPPGKDPDQHSPTLRAYHRLLWSKPLPSGTQFELLPEPGSYLVHRSSRGMFDLTSDAITMRLLGRAWRIIAEIPADSQPEDLGYTIGSVRASNAFIRGRNRRIDAAKFGNGFAGPSTAAAQLDPPEGTVPAG